MFGWLDELMNLRIKYKEYHLRLIMEANQCQSCEALRIALERANYEKDILLHKVIDKPEDFKAPASVEPQAIRKHVPWAMRRELLEKEDREKARIMQEFRNRTETLEKDMNIQTEDKEIILGEGNESKEA